MFLWSLLIFHFLAIDNGLSVNSSSEILIPANNTLDDGLINQFDALKINDNGGGHKEKENSYNKEPEELNINNNFDFAVADKIACEINIRNLPENKPLLRNPTTKKLLLPTEAGTRLVSLKAGEHMEIDCPGSQIVVDGKTKLKEVIDAQCVSGNRVHIKNKTVSFASVTCSKKVQCTARYTNNSRCWNSRGKEIEIGFKFTDGQFIQQMRTCFDPDTRNVFYSLFDLSHQVGDYETVADAPSWTEGKFYNLKVALDKLYKKATQKTTINRLVGLPDASTKYVQSKKNRYLIKGHLAAIDDYVYHIQQEATFHYVNSLPQWRCFNEFNWAYFEANVRKLAAKNKLDLVVMTGGYKVSTLPHEVTGSAVELHLFVDGSSRAVPVPAQIWKVIYSPSTKAGIAVLGINNPFVQDVSNELICPDIADKLEWLSFDRTRVDRGYVYACTIDELRKVIPEIPNYTVKKILN